MAPQVVTTIHDLVTFTKLNGCAQVIRGTTLPEGYTFAVCVLVGTPGNERVLELATQLEAALMAAGAPRTELKAVQVVSTENDK